jgi:hypothetical protein
VRIEWDQFYESTGTLYLHFTVAVHLYVGTDLPAQLIAALGVNFALWGLALVPAWFVVREIGVIHFGPERAADVASESQKKHDSE